MIYFDITGSLTCPKKWKAVSRTLADGSLKRGLSMRRKGWRGLTEKHGKLKVICDFVICGMLFVVCYLWIDGFSYFLEAIIARFVTTGPIG